ncbi:NAD(P)-dependent alcohol dehydrogenase [Pendulispora albinea]|uniref:alcohol dehydrogenase n=1 Tax=Pendulispora albinea TaxID=2741071 RepID=A0ABZ2M8T1_9BACT
MRAAQVEAYGKPLRLTKVPDPKIDDPHDVIVRVAGAGVCRTDLHILEGRLEKAFAPALPYTPGHENAGWVHEVGKAVTHLKRGDPVIVHPAISCGHCDACRAGNDMHCTSFLLPGIHGIDGGYAELLKTSARALVKLADGTDPTRLAPYSDAGLTAIHAVKRLAPFTHAGSTVIVIGSGGLGHIAVQLLRVLTDARVVVLVPDGARYAFMEQFGPDAIYMTGDDGGVQAIAEDTKGKGAHVVLDLVGEGRVPSDAMRMLRKGGLYSIVGYGGNVTIEHLDMINRELTIQGNQIGTYTELCELMELDHRGSVRIESKVFPLDRAVDALEELRAGRILGRAVLVP